MEINHYGDTILGVIAMEDIVEGRFVCLDAHSVSEDFGSKVDLPGARLPDTDADSTRSRYCITFAQDNRPTPLYQSTPSYAWALRQGWDQATNAPFTTQIFLTHQANQEGLTIYSGWAGLAFGEGVYTVPSGNYVYSAAVQIPGTPLAVANTADDGAASAGMLKEASGTTGTAVAEVIRYYTTDGRLTFKILH
jgi:hypothetical protein